MSHITYDNLWEDGMRELVEVLKQEVPTYTFQGPQNLVDYARIYINYFKVYKRLEECCDMLVHPQKRLDCKKCLEAVVGRILEIKHWMVHLNAAKEIINLEDTLVNMELPADVIDVIPPRHLTVDSAANLEIREKFLIKVIEKGEAEGQDEQSKFPAFTEEEAISILQANERGRQARERVALLAKIRTTQEDALKKQQAGHEPLTTEAATIRLQAAARGFLHQCRVKHSAKDEMTLLGINPFARFTARDVAFGRLREIEQKRRNLQLLNYQEYVHAMKVAKELVKDLEGQEMREIIQERINKWLNDNRDPETGFFPPFPKAVDGGSKYIVQPPPQLAFQPEEKKGKKEEKKDDKKKKKAKGPPVPPHAQLPEEDEDKPPSCPKFFLRHVRECVQAYTRTWHDKDGSANLAQKHDMDILKSQLRPLVFEEVRLEVDESTRAILDKIKQRIIAELKAAKKKQKGDAKAEKKESKEKKDDADEPPPPPKKKAKKMKDPSAQRTIESIYAELAKEGIIQCCPKRDFSEFVATDSFFGTNFEMDSGGLDPSMAQVKRLAMEYCVLPLVSDFVHEHAPFIKSVLLYGGEMNGKTLLVHAACRAAGATYINLSPEVTDGKYPGKQATKMLQMAFKIAKVMAPSIVHVSGVEKIFVTDKKKLKTYGLKDKANRLKKPLAKEVQGIRPGDRVLFVGTSARPQDSPGKPSALATFFTKRIYVPYPDYGCRQCLWRALIERHGGAITECFNLPTVSQICDGYSSGAIEQFCKAVLTEKRKRKVRRNPLTINEFTSHIYDSKPVDPELHQALREWAKPKEAADPVAAQDAKDAKGKGKK